MGLLGGRLGHDAAECRGEAGDGAEGGGDFIVQRISIQGHEASVWAVAALDGECHGILTGSADKTVRLWQDGQCTTTFHGRFGC